VHGKLPGLLVGGPNEKEQSGIAPKFKGLLSYADDSLSYATNEYAIDLNASLIGLIGLLLNSSSSSAP
jgi:endoglucanase